MRASLLSCCYPAALEGGCLICQKRDKCMQGLGCYRAALEGVLGIRACLLRQVRDERM